MKDDEEKETEILGKQKNKKKAKSEENGHRKKGYEEHRKTGRKEVDSA